MLIKTRGIVLRAFKYGETSIIADIFTEEKGLQSYIIGGVRRSKPRFAGALLQVGSILDMVVYYSNKSKLHRPRELRAAYIYHSLPYHLPKGSIALFAMEIARKCLHEPESQPLLFQWMYEFLIFVDQTEHSLQLLPHYFLCQFAGHLGFEMQNNFGTEAPFFDLLHGRFVPLPPEEELQAGYFILDEDQNKLLSFLLHSNWYTPSPQPPPSPALREGLLKELLAYYSLHTTPFGQVKSLDILQKVLRG